MTVPVVSAVSNGLIGKAEIENLVGRVVFDGETPSLSEVKFRLESFASTTMGRVVVVEVEADVETGNRAFLLLRVAEVFDVNPHETAESATVRAVIPVDLRYAPEGSSTVIYRVAVAEPLEEVVVGGDFQVLETRPPLTLCRAGGEVFDAGTGLVTAAFGFQAESDLSLEMGVMPDVGVPVNLNRDVVQRHILIAGGIGSGKSYTRGVIAEELARLGVPQVNIDVNGELADCALDLGGKSLSVAGGGFTMPLSALTGRDVADAVPAINRGTNIETLVFEAQEKLIKECSLGLGLDFGISDLQDAIQSLAPELKMDDKRTVYPAVSRVGDLSRLGFIGAPFDWERELVPGAFINLDCRRMTVSDLRLVTAGVARDLQRLAQAGRIPFVVFSVDEFHLVAPQGEEAVTKQVLREVARLGRHLKIGLILTTQSPADVDRAILKRLLTRFLHAIESDQLDALRGVFSDASDSLIKGLPKMPVGRCVVTGAFETVKHAGLVNIRRRVTTDGGGSPPIWDELRDQGWLSKRSLGDLVEEEIDA